MSTMKENTKRQIEEIDLFPQSKRSKTLEVSTSNDCLQQLENTESVLDNHTVDTYTLKDPKADSNMTPLKLDEFHSQLMKLGWCKDCLLCWKNDINFADDCGWTQLMWACKLGNTEAVKELLRDPKIDVHQKTVSRMTALDHACHFGYLDIVKILCDMYDDETKRSAISYASDEKKYDVVKYLLEHLLGCKSEFTDYVTDELSVMDDDESRRIVIFDLLEDSEYAHKKFLSRVPLLHVEYVKIREESGCHFQRKSEEVNESNRQKSVEVLTYKEKLAEKLKQPDKRDFLQEDVGLEIENLYSSYLEYRYHDSCLISKPLFDFLRTAGEDLEQEVRDLLYNYIQGRYFDNECNLSYENRLLTQTIATASFEELEKHVVNEDL